jgi:hypothetical protein
VKGKIMVGFDGMFDNVGAGGGGDFLPIVKYDARAGRISRVDRENGESIPTDITNNFKAVFDFENVEVGFIKFAAGTAPDFRMSRFYDRKPVADPKGDYKPGVRFVIKLGKECGGDIREIASNAGAFLDAAKRLHVEYEAGVKENPGKLPVISLAGVTAKTSGEGQKKSTNYVPDFKIVSWVKRPDDLVYTARGSSVSSEPAQAAVSSSAPSTGSTKVSAPADEDDFG